MRQLRPRALGLRVLVVAATSSVLALAASGPIGSAVTAPAQRAAANADCSLATALRVGKPLFFDPLSKKPVGQVLCGPFTGPGSEAMAISFTAPTCWPIESWAVFQFAQGDWRLVLDQPAYLVPPLVAVGSDIRETTAVHRQGDSRCFPSGGTHARIWQWSGAHLTAGPWKQVTKGEPEGRGFYSPSRGIECGMSDSSGFRGVSCQTLRPPQKVAMDAGGRLKICRRSEARCKLGNAGEDVPILAYGRQITVGRFRCISLRSGVRCTVIRSGKGFLINRDGVRRIES
jgi:hypothetical protein